MTKGRTMTESDRHMVNAISEQQSAEQQSVEQQRTALVTGATSGLGYAAAIQAAEAGYGTVLVTGRSLQSAVAASERMTKESGHDVFVPAAVDLNSAASVETLVVELAGGKRVIDYLLLNAGMVGGSKQVRTEDGVEITSASSLIGHHQLVVGLLDRGVLSHEVRVVIAGSEAARGDVPTFKPTKLRSYAGKHYDGVVSNAVESLLTGTGPVRYNPANVYADAKAFVAMWAAALARRLPEGMTVNAVSPGSAPDTGAARNANFFMKRIMMPVMKAMPARLGFAADVPVAAARYLQASKFPAGVNGQFYASAPKKMTGNLHRVDLGHLSNIDDQESVWSAVVAVAEAPYEPGA